MSEEKTTKITQDGESTKDQPKRRTHRRKTAKPAEEIVSTPQPSRSRKKSLDEAIAAVFDATASSLPEMPAEEEKGAEKKPARRRGGSRGEKKPRTQPAREPVPQTAEPAPAAPQQKKSSRSRRGRSGQSNADPSARVRIIPLGGLHEIGKNMTVYESGDDMFIVDCGLAFPDDDMFGVDVVIPDFTFVEKNKDKIRGIVITHGHEDHIGGWPICSRR